MNENERLVQEARDLIRKHYVKHRHHVVSVLLSSSGKKYIGVHLDTHGFDICAEPSAMAAAILDGETEFKKIVAVYWNGDEQRAPTVVAPCGNCRQLLFEYAPKIEVLLEDEKGLKVQTAENLFPSPYQKPL